MTYILLGTQTSVIGLLRYTVLVVKPQEWGETDKTMAEEFQNEM